MLFKQLSNCPNGRAVYLESVRILSREKSQIEELFTKEMINILVKLAGLDAEEEDFLNQGSKNCDMKGKTYF